MRHLLTIILTFTSIVAFAQGPNNTGTYYKNANGKKAAELKSAMYSIISPHTTIGYKDLGSKYQYTDKRPDGYLWDMYSNVTNYSFSNNGGNSTEGAGWNKEHSVPQSWFGGASPMYSDIFHVVPTDAFINNMRSNHPFGETKNPTKTSKNGFSKLGPCSVSGYSGTCFEPNDEYKGDFARIYFYMVTCYENRQSSFTQSEGSNCFAGNTYPCFKDWFLQMLLRWAENDPVSQKEIDRNNAAYKLQGNRNPFVDYPKLEQYIWGSCMDKVFSYDNYDGPTPVIIPDVPTAIAATNITADGFRANWIESDNSESYTIELRKTNKNVTEDQTVLVETFAKCNGTGNTENNECDSYMDNKGWDGSGIFPDKNKLRMASGKKASKLLSPTLLNPNGHVIVNFSENKYNTDNTTITVSIHDAQNNIIASKSVTAENESHSVQFDNVDYDYKVSFASAGGDRYYLTSIEVIAGGGAATTVTEYSGIIDDYYIFKDLDKDFLYSYRVKGVNKEGSSDWSNSIEVTLGGDNVLLGDANNDGKVDVADITTIASYILGNKPENFNAKNADANEDGSIDVADITTVATIILSAD